MKRNGTEWNGTERNKARKRRGAGSEEGSDDEVCRGAERAA